MRSVFIRCHAAVADFKHIGIVPMAWPGVSGNIKLSKTKSIHRSPVILDVASSAPQVTTYIRPPFPDISNSVFAKTVNDRPSSSRQSITHLLIKAADILRGRLINSAGAAEIVFKIVHTPRRISGCVLLFMPITTFIPCAGLRSWRGVNANLQSLRMNIIGKSLHVRKFCVCDDIAIGVSPSLPGVINVDVDVPGFAHPAGDDSVSRLTDGGIIHFPCKLVPAIPAHGGRTD